MKPLIFFIKSHWEFCIGLVLTLSLLWPLFASPYFSHHDNVQLIRLYELDKCFKDNQIPCRWVPDLGGEYGYPLFNYYAPLAYYYGEIFYLLFGNLILAAKIMFLTAFVGSFVFMYLLARKLWGETGGTLSAIFFAFAPYHASLFYVRGAMGELWGVMFFPALLWAALRLKEKVSISNVLLLSLFVASLVLSHNLSSMIFMPVVAAFVLVIGISNKFNFFKNRFFYYVILSVTLGLLLSAFYWMPATMEKTLAHVDSTISGYFGYTEHFKGLRKLFVERMWGWGASVLEVNGRQDGMSFQIGWVHIFAWFLSGFVAFKLWKKDKKSFKLLTFFITVALYAIFMINPRSEFIWKLVDSLKYLQFPWRFLGIVIFAVSVSAGSIFLGFDKKYWKKLWIGFVILVVALNFSYFKPEKFIYVNDHYIFEPEEWDSQIKRSIFDYLPIYAKAPPAELATTRYELLTGEAEVKDLKEGTNWFTFNADVKTHTIIRLSQYYFPNWVIKVDGQEVNIDWENPLGLMTIILGEGQHFVEGRLNDTTVRAIGNRLTVVAATIFFVVSLLQLKRFRRWVLYYLKRID